MLLNKQLVLALISLSNHNMNNVNKSVFICSIDNRQQWAWIGPTDNWQRLPVQILVHFLCVFCDIRMGVMVSVNDRDQLVRSCFNIFETGTTFRKGSSDQPHSQGNSSAASRQPRSQGLLAHWIWAADTLPWDRGWLLAWIEIVITLLLKLGAGKRLFWCYVFFIEIEPSCT